MPSTTPTHGHFVVSQVLLALRDPHLHLRSHGKIGDCEQSSSSGTLCSTYWMKEKMFGNCGGFGFNVMVLWTEHLCSLNLSLRHHLVSAMYCKWQRLCCITDLSAT